MNNLFSIDSNKKYELWIFLAVLLALSSFMVCWFGPVSEYSGHDYYFNIGRFNVLIGALKSGNYPIYLDYNALETYGYFTKGFYPDLIILPFAALGILTGTVAAYNVMIFTMTFLCGLFMYWAVNTVFRNFFAASVSAILYTFSAYHLFDWYNRAALGESISFTFLPLIFLGLYHIILGDYKKWYLLTIGYSLIIYTHLLSSFLTFITLVLVVLICCKLLLKEPKRIGYLVLAAIVALPIAGSYIFPMLEQMASNTFYYELKENITGQTKLGLIEIGWGMLSGILYPKTNNLAGIGPLIILFVFLRIFIREKTKVIKIADLCLLMGVFYLIVLSAIFPWGRLPFGFIQFPWRLYEFIVFFLSIAGSYYLFVILKTKKRYIISGAGILIFTVIVIIVNNNNYKYWQTLAKKDVPEWFTGIPSIDNEYYLGGLEYLPVKVPSYNFIHERGNIIESGLSETSTTNLIKEKGVTKFDVTVKRPDKVELPLVYYKGYKAVLNNTTVLAVEESNSGLVQIPVSESGNIEIYYEETAIQKISWYITLFSILILCVYIVVFEKRKNTTALISNNE